MAEPRRFLVETPAQLAKDEADRRKATDAYDKAIVYPDTPKSPPPVKRAKGGYVRAADGVAQRGKTKGRLV
jgi:hypothetical protein